MLYDVLRRVLVKPEVSDSHNKNNAGYSILFEAISLIISDGLDAPEPLRDQGIILFHLRFAIIYYYLVVVSDQFLSFIFSLFYLSITFTHPLARSLTYLNKYWLADWMTRCASDTVIATLIHWLTNALICRFEFPFPSFSHPQLTLIQSS